MAKFTPIPTIGAGDLNSITEFLGYLKEPEKYKERLNALENRRKEINDLIETVGKVNEIERLRSEALSSHKNAKDILEAAVKSSEASKAKIISNEAESSKLIHDGQLKLDLEARDREASLKSRERLLNKGLAEYLTAVKKFEDEKHQVQMQKDDNEIIKNKYQSALHLFKEAINEVSKAL